MPAQTSLSAAEVCLLLSVPFLYDTLWASLAGRERVVHPHDLTPSQDASSDRAAFERFAQSYSQPYRRAISAGTWTVPGHASLLTGRLPTSHGAYRAPGGTNAATALDASVETLAERLSAAGYDTAAFLANHAYLDPAFGLSRGFRVYETENLYPAATLVRRVTHWLDHEARRPAFLFLNVLDAHEPYAAPP